MSETNGKDASWRAPAAQKMMANWKICQDVKGSTMRIREEKIAYLPRFEAEEQRDWDARVKMTFVDDYYEQTLNDCVGLVFAEPPRLNPDVPAQLLPLLENVDGEGTHWEVYAQRVFEKALDYGHAIILTDYPAVLSPQTMATAKAAQLRPYLLTYTAADIWSWRVATVGGVKVVTQIVLQEYFEDDDGEFATEEIKQYRVLRQAVIRDEFETPLALGALSWELWRELDDETQSGQTVLRLVGSGPIIGPKTIPVRVIYGGARENILVSKPTLLSLAVASIEATQVGSDYAQVMHKCNVPTPVFVGRGRAAKAGATTKMGVAIDLPMGATASMLEPTGSALGATRARLEDIRAQMKRHGAFVNESSTPMTATEAALYAKQRNAKLARAARSLQDALEGALDDMAAFADINNGDGGSMTVNTDFNASIDARSLDVYLRMYQANALPLWALLEVAKTGAMPDDFDVDAVALELTTQASAEADRNAKMMADAVGAQVVGAITRPPNPMTPKDPTLAATSAADGLVIP